MENEGKKKDVEIKTKSPMSLVILIAVLVIALGCEFVYIRQLKNDIEKVTNNNGKNIVSNIQNQTVNNQSSKQTVTQKDNNLTNEEAKKIGEELFEKANSYIWDESEKNNKVNLYNIMTENAKKMYNNKTSEELELSSVFRTVDAGKKNLNVNSNKENIIVFDVIEYTLEEVEGQGEEIDRTVKEGFTIKKVNDKWLIEAFK